MAKTPEPVAFQEVPGLDSRSSLILAATRYEPPTELDALPFFSGSLALDSFGNRYAGQYRPATDLNVHGLLRQSDLLNLRSLGSNEDGHYRRLVYHLDLGPWRSRLGLMLADMSYKLGKELDVLEAEGEASTHSVFVIQPLLQSDALRLQARLQFDDKHLQDRIGLIGLQSDKRSRVLSYRLGGNLHDELLGSASNDFDLGWSEGRLNVDGSADSLTGRVEAGHFRILRASLSRAQSLSQRLSLHAHAQGQWTNDTLDDSEKLYLGGAFGVRAYPQTEAPGDRGWLANLELRYALSDAWQLAVFADQGKTQQNSANLTADSRTRRLSGAGLGAKWAAESWQVSVTAAWQLENDAPQGDRKRHPRIWSQIAYRF